MSEPESSSLPSGRFATTRWTVVLAAGGDSPEADQAMAELCADYWQPVFEFVRRRARDEEEARDLTQEFFARLVARRGLRTLQPGRSRFRSFLLGAVKHFLADSRAREQAAKRGGGATVVPWDAADEGGGSESSFGEWEASAPPPQDREFDRDWAASLVNRALDRLAREHEAAGRGHVFAALKPWLAASPIETAEVTRSETARALGWTENAVRVAVHWLRRRFREVVRDEIARTVEDEGKVGEEIRYLIEVLSQ